MKGNKISTTTQKAGAKTAQAAIDAKRPRFSTPVPKHKVNFGQGKAK